MKRIVIAIGIVVAIITIIVGGWWIIYGSLENNRCDQVAPRDCGQLC